MTRPTVLIRPPSLSLRTIGRNLARLVECRDLLYTMTLHRISVRYKQSVLGYFWAVLHPVILLLLYTTVFTRFVKVPTNGKPYAIFAFTALLPWTYFSNGLSAATIGLPANSYLMSRVYFPREILPLSYVLAALLDFLIASVVLLSLMLYYRYPLTPAALYVVPAMLTLTVFLIGAALFTSALQARFRDIGLAMPLVLQVWMFATPVVYPRSAVPETLRGWYDLNPLVAVVETFRGALLGTALPERPLVLESLAVSLVVAVVSYLWFKHVEATLVDVI